jgi:hypothetical protein
MGGDCAKDVGTSGTTLALGSALANDLECLHPLSTLHDLHHRHYYLETQEQHYSPFQILQQFPLFQNLVILEKFPQQLRFQH